MISARSRRWSLDNTVGEEGWRHPFLFLIFQCLIILQKPRRLPKTPMRCNPRCTPRSVSAVENL